MRRLTAGEGREFDFPATDPARRAEAISAMGYRLAAAGPRTRQRLMDREAGPSITETPPNGWLAPGIIGADESGAWGRFEHDEDDEDEPGLARLSEEPAGYRVWRVAALLVSAACGFALVLYGQTLNLDRTSNRDPAWSAKQLALAKAGAAKAGAAQTARAPEFAAQAPSPTPGPAPGPAAPAEPALRTQTLVPQPVPPSARMAAPAAAPAQAQPQLAAARLPAAQLAAAAKTAARFQSATLPAPVRPRQMAVHHPVVAAWSAPTRAPMRMMVTMAAGPTAPRPAVPKPHQIVRTASAHYELPRWIAEPQKPVTMSPPPHDLAAPAAAKSALPPLPRPAPRPALVYAEAHYPAPPRPPAYGYAPSYYPPGYSYYGGPQ